MFTNILKEQKLISIIKMDADTLKFIYSTGRESVVNSLVWSTMKADSDDPEPTRGRVNFFQGGAVSGPGVAGVDVSIKYPLDLTTSTAVKTTHTEIDTVVTWMIANLKS